MAKKKIKPLTINDLKNLKFFNSNDINDYIILKKNDKCWIPLNLRNNEQILLFKKLIIQNLLKSTNDATKSLNDNLIFNKIKRFIDLHNILLVNCMFNHIIKENNIVKRHEILETHFFYGRTNIRALSLKYFYGIRNFDKDKKYIMCLFSIPRYTKYNDYVINLPSYTDCNLPSGDQFATLQIGNGNILSDPFYIKRIKKDKLDKLDEICEIFKIQKELLHPIRLFELMLSDFNICIEEDLNEKIISY